MSQSFGRYIKDKLERRGWSPSQLAAHAGVPKSTLSRLLSDENDMMPDLVTLVRIADALEEPVFHLLVPLGLMPKGDLDRTATDARLPALLRQVPSLAPLLPQLVALSTAEQAAAVAYIEWIIHRAQAADAQHPRATQVPVEQSSDVWVDDPDRQS